MQRKTSENELGATVAFYVGLTGLMILLVAFALVSWAGELFLYF